LAVVLTGSQAREGMATARSDYDVLLVIADNADRTNGTWAGQGRRDAVLDWSAMPLAEFRKHALPGSGTEWNRYAFAHAKVLKDTPDDLIAQLVAAKGTLSRKEAAATAPGALDAFLNGLYRCLKSDRDGDPFAARLDAAEALPLHLGYVFTLHQRVRPYNKYLAWELRHHPLRPPEWSADRLLGLLGATLGTSPAEPLRSLFNDLEPYARRAGHGTVLDAWGPDLRLMRGPAAT
jgi:hypothetical protein